MENVCIFDVSRVMMFHGTEQDGYEAAKIDADQANIVAIYNWRNAPTERKFMDFLIEFEDRAPEWIPWSADLDASVPYGEYVMREWPLFLLRTNKALADKQRAALNKQETSCVLRKVLANAETRHRVESRLSVEGGCMISRSPAILSIMRGTLQVVLVGGLQQPKQYLSLFGPPLTGPATGEKCMLPFEGSQTPVTNQRFSHTNEAYE